MPQQDTTETKAKIISIIERRGPSLPVHVAKETGLSMLFASAFLSELLSEKKIRITSMKVGSSPVYFIQGQESRLEEFSQHLKSREKDAFELLKNNKFLSDKNQEPAIRVALRSIKDFAVPFQRDEEIYWRYFTAPESEFQSKEKPEVIPKEEEKEEDKKDLNIFEKDETAKQKKVIKPKNPQSQNNKFFDKVKDLLSKKQAEIVDVLSMSKEDLVLKIRENEEEYILIAYNKRRITEKDIIKAHKKVLETGMGYRILNLGEPSKKLTDLIKAIKELESIGKV